LEDAKGVDCLPNVAIFEQLTLMGTVASAIICLATNQKFNFSKYIFQSMVKNLDNMNKFLMYPRFVQVFLDKKLEGMSNHNRIYVPPSHTKKIFGNMRRVGKDEAVNKEMDDSLERATTNTTRLDAKHGRGNIFKTQSKATSNEPSYQGTSSGVNTPRSGKDSLKLNELMELCTKLQQMVLDLETTKTTQALEIDIKKKRVKKLERQKRSRTHGLKRLYKVGLSTRVESSKDKGLGEEDAS
nr:hypothetical protein [Tanacetum cinerariifolium]